MPRNPFKPTAGATPPLLLGRAEEINQYAEALENGHGDPHLLTLVTGARGTGKTVMLTELGDLARKAGWFVIDETATRGFVDRIGEQARNLAAEQGKPTGPRVTGVNVPIVGGVSFSHDVPEKPSWRTTLTELLEIAQRNGTGVVITVDEVQAATQEELQQLAADIQHMIRSALPISLVMAGLPRAVEDSLLKGEASVSTFLRRAERIRLEDIPIPMVRDALTQMLAEGNRAMKQEDIVTAAQATGGYPFMIQLVGYNVWRLTDEQGFISSKATQEGIKNAGLRLGSLVHEPALAELSDVDKTVLMHMVHDEGPTRIGDLVERMGRDSGYVAVYRQRLLDAGIVSVPQHGYLDFAMPYLRDYLRDHATSLLTRKR